MDPTVLLGNGTFVWAFATIFGGVVIGEFCNVGTATYIGRGAKIGNRVRIGDKCYIVDHMEIGNDVFIGPMVKFSNDRHPIVNNPNFKREDPIVEDNVSVGVGATILPGVRLGRGCMVGGGAVVTKDVAPYTIVVGNPAIPLREMKERESIIRWWIQHNPIPDGK